MTLVPLINISIYVFVYTMLIPSLSLVCDSLRFAPINYFDFNKRRTWPAILISNYFSTALVIAYSFLFYTDNKFLVELKVLLDVQ